ncbi:TPA: hypothetical protein L3685_005977 [Pseudomonas aeruginosa]|nr:hypothetical protein [Pseudomonas aeruginosa]HBN8980248.1 hypothetical protein [Pseudomonas aeruginosa]
MNDRTIPAGDNAPAKQPAKQRPQVGDYLMKIEEVPKEVRDYAVNKLSPKDADGNRLKDDAGKEVRAGIAAAKENGSYYGPVVLNNDKFIVQAVGKDRSYLEAHGSRDEAGFRAARASGTAGREAGTDQGAACEAG